MKIDGYQLVKLCKKGDAQAQFQLYKLYSKAMFNIAIRMSGNREEAHDITQDAFIKAFTNIHTLNDDFAFGGWLKQITIRLCLDYRKKKKPFYFEETSDGALPEDMEEEEFDSNISEELVHDAIKELPDGAREILVLKALEGYRHAEISEKLGISESTSKTQYFRAKQLLGELIKKEIHEKEPGEIFEKEKVNT